MTADERAEKFVKRFPPHSGIDKKFVTMALTIEFLEAAGDQQTNPNYKPVSTLVPEKPLAPRTFDLGVYGY